jgi:hypothetical protein
MKASTEPLPIIRVSRPKAGTVRKPPPALDVQMYDLLGKVVNNAGRLRARLDGCEARLEHLEEMLKRGYR